MGSKLISQEKDTCYACKYKVETLIFKLKDKKIKMNGSNILSVEKLDNFDHNIRAIIHLTLKIDLRHKLWIIKNKHDITCKFEMSIIGVEQSGEEFIIGPNKLYNGDYVIRLNDDDDNTDTAMIESSLNTTNEDDFALNDIDGQDYYESENIFDVYLFSKKLLTASNKKHNKVYTSSCLQNIVAQILTETGHKKVLMSPFENSAVYSELVVPSNAAYKTLSYLDQYYGFYKTGSQIFYDIDILYIINSNGKVTAKRSKEWTETTFLVTAKTNSMPGNGMVKKQKEKVFYCNITEENINPQRPSSMISEREGEDVQIINPDDVTVKVSDKSNVTTRLHNSDDSKYFESVIKARRNENDAILYINGEGFDMNAFTPNKTFKVIFEEPTKQKKYGKNRYRIAYAIHSIKFESGNYMQSAHQIVLKKC